MANRSTVRGKFLAKANKRITQRGNGVKTARVSVTRPTRIRVKKA